MNKDNKVIGRFAGGLLVGWLAGIAVVLPDMVQLRNSAIDAGVGRWTVDKHGSKEFQWVTNRVQPIGPGIDLRGPRTVTLPWYDYYTNGIVLLTVEQWRQLQERQWQPPMTNYTMPLPYTPGIWTSTNIWLDLSGTNTYYYTPEALR